MRDIVPLEHRLPLVQTFERILLLVEAVGLDEHLMIYARVIIEDLKSKYIALDGKITRGSKKCKGGIHIPSVWFSEMWARSIPSLC